MGFTMISNWSYLLSTSFFIQSIARCKVKQDAALVGLGFDLMLSSEGQIGAF